MPRRSPGRARTEEPRTRVRLSVDARRKQLLALGRQAFTAQRYDDVSTDAIATRAGVSRGLLFHYFPSKRDYHLAVLREAADELLAKAFAKQTGAPLERLAAGLHA